jgi:predicted DNA-binding transcriptional regulator YafY
VGTVEQGSEGALLRIGADDGRWLAGYLIGLALPFEVVEPLALREEVREVGARIAAAHSAP